MEFCGIYMKLALSLLPALLVFQCLAQPQTASVQAYSRSLSLHSVTASGSALYNFNFTTVNRNSGLPFYLPGAGGTVLVSNEVHPVAGERGLYESDYVLLLNGALAQYGSLQLTIPSPDNNQDGVPDVIDPAQPMYSSVSGTGHSTWPSSNSFTLNLRMNRAAGSPAGAFSGIWTPVGASFIVNGSLQLPLLQGTATYTRGRQNQLQLQLTRRTQDGSSTTLTGAVVYAASANSLSLPRFGLTDTNGQSYAVLPMTLTRKGNRFSGKLKFVDGAPETPWIDYVNWLIQITDSNDSNTNGIPDLSDPAAVQIPTAPLWVTNDGPGTVIPALSGQNLELDKTYKLTATPAVGNLFAGWTGDLVSDSPTLSFLMVTNLTLTAHFVPNPFHPVRGTYNGLIGDTNALANQTLGSITATTTERGTYSAKVRLGGRSYSLSGSFDSTGTASPAWTPAELPPLLLELHLDLVGGTGLSGTISNEAWTASIAAHKASFNRASNPCAYAGKYTLVIPSAWENDAVPAGDGYGTVRVDAGGRLSFAGALADGTRVTQSTSLSATADWGFYASLYAHQGCVSSWVRLANPSVYPGVLNLNPGHGLLTWLKPASARARFYPAGFTNQVYLLLSPYSAPAQGTSLLEWTNGVVNFSGGNLDQSFFEDISVDGYNKLASATTNRLSLRLLANGLFRGRVTPPDGSRSFSFQGALLQDAGLGRGFLLGTNQSAKVQFGSFATPAPNTNFPAGP